VFRADLRVLTRNEGGFPGRFSRFGVRDLGAFAPNPAARARPFNPAAFVIPRSSVSRRRRR